MTSLDSASVQGPYDDERLQLLQSSEMIVSFEENLHIIEGKGEHIRLSSGERLDIPYHNRPIRVDTTLNIKVILAGNIKYPDKYRPIGPILHITSEQPFKRNIQISSKHNAILRGDQDKKHVKFLVSHSSGSPIEFSEESEIDAEFVFEEYVTAELASFSFLMPVFKIVQRQVSCLYGCYIFHRDIPNTNKANIVLVTTKRQPDYLDFARKIYIESGWDLESQEATVVQFEGVIDFIGIDLPDPSITIKGWQFESSSPLKIHKKQLDSMQSMPNIQCIHSCYFDIKWVGSGTPSSLCHKINLVGAIEGHDSVTINYTRLLGQSAR